MKRRQNPKQHLAILGVILVVAIVAIALTTIDRTPHAERSGDKNLIGQPTNTLEPTLSPTRTLFQFRWNDRADADRRQIAHATIVGNTLVLLGGGIAGGYQDQYGEGLWGVDLATGTVTVRELSFDGGSAYRCPLNHGLATTRLQASGSGTLVSVANNGNVECTQSFQTGDGGPRGFISYTAPPLQKNALLPEDGQGLYAETDEFTITTSHALIHTNSGKSKLYGFPGMAFIADTQEIVPLGSVGELIIGYDAAEFRTMASAPQGTVQYNTYKVSGTTLQKVQNLPGIVWTKSPGFKDWPITLIRDSTNPSRSVIQTARGKLFAVQTTGDTAQVTPLGDTPMKTYPANQFNPTPFTAALPFIGVGGEYLVFGAVGSSSAYTFGPGNEEFVIWKGTNEIAKGLVPRKRPVTGSTEPYYPNWPRAAFFRNNKLIVVASHGAFEYDFQNGGAPTNPPPACKAAGASCAGYSECCSQTCAAGVCFDDQTLSPPENPVFECEIDTDCEEGWCNDGTCETECEADEDCGEDEWCDAGLCEITTGETTTAQFTTASATCTIGTGKFYCTTPISWTSTGTGKIQLWRDNKRLLSCGNAGVPGTKNLRATTTPHEYQLYATTTCDDTAAFGFSPLDTITVQATR